MNQTSREMIGDRFYYEVSASPGTPQVVSTADGHRATVAVFPGVGGTALLEFTLSSPDMVAAGTARWVAWSSGTVSAITPDVFPSPITALRLTAFTAPAVLEFVQV